jgi:hypothetical protein
MKLIAFIEGRCRPQARTTVRSKFLFSKTVEQWQKVDDDNALKALHGMINKKGNPFKPTRYAYRLNRLQVMNEWRAKVFETVSKACNNGMFMGSEVNIPKQFLFNFYLFHSPKSWSKKKAKSVEWQLHGFKPDYSNLGKLVDDAIFENDSDVNAVAHYKIYVPHNIPEGIMILQDEEIHKFVIDSAIEMLTIKFPI